MAFSSAADSRNDTGSILSAAARQRESLHASIVGICANALLFVIKLIAGLLSGSVSMIADAANSLSDASSSILSLIGVKLASRPADREHPFGHGRIEYLSALFISIIMILIGFTSLYTSVRKIRQPALTEPGLVPLAILLGSLMLKYGLASYYRKLAVRLSSVILSAAAADARNDLVVTGAAIAVLLIERLLRVPVDGWVGLAVSVFVLISGFQVMKDTTLPLIGEEQNPDLCREITELVEANDGILGTHDLAVHSYGPDRHLATIHVEVPDTMTLTEAHRIADQAERDVLERLGVSLVVHADPVAVGDPVVNAAKDALSAVLGEIDPEVSFHDFRVVPGKKHINLVFDLVLPYAYDEERREALTADVQQAMSRKDTRYHCHIQCDRQ